MTYIKCRICHKIIVHDIFSIRDEEYKKLIAEHLKTHTKAEIDNTVFYMSDVE